MNSPPENEESIPRIELNLANTEQTSKVFPFVPPSSSWQLSVKQLSTAIIVKEIVYYFLCIGIPTIYVEGDEINPTGILIFVIGYSLFLLLDLGLRGSVLKLLAQESRNESISRCYTFFQYLLLSIGGLWPFFLACTVAIVSHLRTASAYSSISTCAVLVFCHLLSLFFYAEADPNAEQVSSDPQRTQRDLLRRVRAIWN